MAWSAPVRSSLSKVIWKKRRPDGTIGTMKLPGVYRSHVAGLTIAFWAVSLAGQNTPFVAITPHTVTLTVGDSRPFRLVNQEGKIQHNVSWSVSDSDALQLQGSDELVLTARREGDFRLSAHSAAGGDEIDIKVVAGSLSPGTIMWSGPVVPGCKATNITQAVPTQNGPDLYEETQCEDGRYVTAYTAEGVQLWRRRITTEHATAAPATVVTQNQEIAKPLNIHSSSICDLIPPGAGQEKIRDLLQKRSLSFTADNASEGRVWTVEENGTECKLWFDGKAVLIKKRRTLISE
jgi:hypothetical protein